MNKIHVPRDPEVDVRVRRFMEQVSIILNSLVDFEILVQVAAGKVGIAGLMFSGTTPPPATLGITGDFYFDSNNGILYKKV